jgi:hypothetical protein
MAVGVIKMLCSMNYAFPAPSFVVIRFARYGRFQFNVPTIVADDPIDLVALRGSEKSRFTLLEFSFSVKLDTSGRQQRSAHEHRLLDVLRTTRETFRPFNVHWLTPTTFKKTFWLSPASNEGFAQPNAYSATRCAGFGFVVQQ